MKSSSCARCATDRSTPGSATRLRIFEPPAEITMPVAAPAVLTRDELIAWGRAVGARLEPGTTVAISGDLGAGKTTLVQAICAGYGVRDDVTSPTFALVHEYTSATSPVFHLDLYRLETRADVESIGFEEFIRPDVLTLVEWPERAAACMPAGAMTIELAHVDGDADRRRLSVR